MRTEIRVINPITPLNNLMNSSFNEYANNWNTVGVTNEALKYPVLYPVTGETEYYNPNAVPNWNWQNGYMMSESGSIGPLSQSITGITTGQTYNVKFKVAGYDNALNTGTLNFSLYGNTGYTINSDGYVNYDVYIASQTDTLMKFTPSTAFIGGITNVSITPTVQTTRTLDMYDDDTYNITFQIQSSISNKSSSYSKTIKLPATANNNLIFNNLQDINRYLDDSSFTDSTIFLNKKIPVGIYSDSIELMTGYLELQNVINNGNFTEYEVVFYSTIKSLADSIGEKVLRGNNILNSKGQTITDNGDLDFSIYNHLHNQYFIQQGWDKTSSNYINGTGVYYPLIDYANISEGNQYRLENFKPSLYVKEIWDKIFTKAGFTYTSDFLNTDHFKSLIIAEGSTLEEYSLFVDNTKFMVGITNDTFTKTLGNPGGSLQTNTYGSDCWDRVTFEKGSGEPLFNNNSTWDTTNKQWNISSTGVYDFNAVVRYNLYLTTGASFTLAHPPNLPSNVSDWFGVKLRIMRRRMGITTVVWEGDEKIITVTGTTFTPPCYMATNGVDENYVLVYKEKMQCKVFDILWVEIGLNNHLAKSLPGGNALLGVSAYPKKLLLYKTDDTIPALQPYTECHNAPTTYDYYLEGSYVFANDILPRNTKQIDFIKSVCNRFNLMFTEDKTNSKNLLIENYDNFYFTGNTIDWSMMVDRSKDMKFERIPLLIDKDVKFETGNGKDFLSSLYKGNYGDNFGDNFIKDPYYSDDTEIINDMFVSPQLGELGSGTGMLVPKVYFDTTNDNPWFLPTSGDYGTIMLYRNMIGKSNTTGNTYGTIIVTTSNSDSGITSGYTTQNVFTLPYNNLFPYAGYLDHPFNPTKDLNYGIAKQYHSGARLSNNNSYFLYWMKKISMYSDINSRMLTCYVNIKNGDISKLDFRKEIYIDNIRYRLQKIYDWNGTGSCKVELIKVVPFNRGNYVLPNAWQQQVVLPGNTALKGVPKNNLGNQSIKQKVINLQSKTPYLAKNGENYISNQTNQYPEWTVGMFIGKGNEVNYDNYFVKGDNNTINGSFTTIIESSNNVVNSSGVVLIGSNSNTINDALDGIVLINTSGITITQNNKSYINNRDTSTFLDVSTANATYVSYTDIALSKNIYTIPIMCTRFSPADGDTLYIGMHPDTPDLNESYNKIHILKEGTIRMASITAMAHTVGGSAEDWSVYIRLNANDDYLIQTVSLSADERTFSNDALDIPIVGGDSFEIKIINPTWATNPTNVTFAGYIILDIT